MSKPDSSPPAASHGTPEAGPTVDALAGPSPSSLRRNAGGPRTNVSKRVTVHKGSDEFDGWALNVSRGGIRLILEDPVETGDDLIVVLGDEDDPDYFKRDGKVAWVKQAPDGVIIGVEFTDDRPSAGKVPAMSTTMVSPTGTGSPTDDDDKDPTA